MSYWTQFSFDEIKAMQGREIDDQDDDAIDDDAIIEMDEEEEEIRCCRRGCELCLL